MQKMIKTLSVFILCHLVLISGVCYGDEEELFSSLVEPDALITLDLSGSMNATPYGDYLYSNSRDGSDNCNGDKAYGTSQGSYKIRCESDNYVCSASSACTEPYYKANLSGGKFSSCPSGKYDCRKANIARKAIFSILDDSGDGKLKDEDQTSLGIRLAYMRFKYCNTVEDPVSSPNYLSGCNTLLYGFQDISRKNYYKDLYQTISDDIDAGFANKTPLRAQLLESKAYLNDTKTGTSKKIPPDNKAIAADPKADCRKKFVVFITDGWDTLACGGDYNKDDWESGSYSYMRRRATIKAAKEVADAGYKVFVIGFGADMPQEDQYTLEWAAKFGGTNNSLVDDSGDANAISIAADPCQRESCSPSQLGCTNAPNDPGYKALGGYAYLAVDSTSLNQALRKAMTYVREARYSFTVSSVSAARVTAQNYLYEASFIPIGGDPFWQGHLKKYKLDDTNGKVLPAILDAGDGLRGTWSRNMYTYFGGTIKPFNAANVSPTLLGLSDTDTTRRDYVVGYFRGENTNYTKENWRLGDTFHSNPVTIDPPSIYFNDVRSWNAFDSFRAANKNRDWLIVLGANDGQVHAFNAGDLAERWSFIPPNLLRKLKLISHDTEDDLAKYPKTDLKHQFYVDGPVTVADVWLGSGDGYGKTADKWRTMMIVGLGKGVRESDTNSDPTYLWSSSPSCDSDFRRKWNPPHQYYCGYYAFDLTNTSATTPSSPLLSSPTSLWRINVAGRSQGLYLDEPWSKMAIGRVKDGGMEKWVGFIGGGFSGDTNKKKRDYDDDDFETKQKRGGKGLFVIELSTGNILWSYTRDDETDMDYPIPASPTVLDWDNDGFIDTAYIADLGGNVWRFRFCSLADGDSCTWKSWKGSRLFNSTGVERPVFTTPSVAMDASSQLWVFWGTGNKLAPQNTTGTDRFFAVRDKDFTSTFTKGSLEKIGDTTAYHGAMDGWYYEFPNSGEKELFDSAVFGGMVLFTTYTPAASTGGCTDSGTGRLYALAMMPITIGGVTYYAGAGLMSAPSNKSSTDGGSKSISLGTGSGIATTPMISQKPQDTPGVTKTTDLYFGTSGGGETSAAVNAFSDFYTPPERGKPCPAGTPPALCRLAQTPPQAQIIHWRDRRLLQ